jgi:hypothetical protein
MYTEWKFIADAHFIFKARHLPQKLNIFKHDLETNEGRGKKKTTTTTL